MDELLELSTKDLTESMVEFLVEDDDGDLDWVSKRLRKKAEREKKVRKQYMKGPDTMSKSKHTQQHY